LYQQTRSKFSPRQQLLFADLENSVFFHDTCSWCLQTQCDGSSSSPLPENRHFSRKPTTLFAMKFYHWILPATCTLACEQAAPTLSTISGLDRLLGYVSSHPNGRKASDMILRVHSDASHLSRPRAGSFAGSVHYMGSFINFSAIDPEALINHSVSAHSTRIPVVVSFVAEAEIAGVFAAARIALDERQILTDLGHPQPPTVIYCDNECAIGLANRTMTPKFSKSLDMRFHWSLAP
jgi:hypothetical protein